MKKWLFSGIVCALALTGCTSHISDDIPSDGKMAYEDVTWPELDDAWIEKGTYPNLENLAKIRPGMTKDQIYALIGHPQFAEGYWGVIEWDYIFNFPQKDGSVKVCQYKVIFDEDYLGQSFFSHPQGCISGEADGELDSDQDGVPDSRDLCPGTPLGTVVDADGCAEKQILGGLNFDFDKSNLRPLGKSTVAAAANYMKQNPNLTATIVGHTDSYGSDAYNKDLSLRRANTVKAEMVNNGVEASRLKTAGYGESQPIATNSTAEGREQNRRVEIIYNK